MVGTILFPYVNINSYTNFQKSCLNLIGPRTSIDPVLAIGDINDVNGWGGGGACVQIENITNCNIIYIALCRKCVAL